MYKKNTASQKIIGIKHELANIPVINVLTDFISSLSSEFDMNPKVYKTDRDNCVWVLYEYSSFDCSNFLDEYGIPIAYISQRFPLSICGMLEDMDSAELKASFNESEDKVIYTKENTSGSDFDNITNICVKVSCDSKDYLCFMYDFLASLNYRCNYIAIPHSYNELPEIQKLPEFDKYTYYKYIIINSSDELADSNHLDSLSVPQKTNLWRLFLQDGISPLEFEYVLEYLNEGKNINMFTWELALQIALSESEISINYESNNFRITDKNGNRLMYDYLTGNPAEKLLLKILFPVVPKKLL